MKRTFAVVALLAALGVLLKLTVKDDGAPRGQQAVAADPAQAADREAELVAKYPEQADLVRRVVQNYRQNALAVEGTDGLRGLQMLDTLGLEAIYLYENHPNDFRRLRDTLSDNAAAEVLLHWRTYFGLKQNNDTDRKILIAEVGRLSPSQRKAAAKYPNALPLLLTDPTGVTELIQRWSGDESELVDALAVLAFVSLESGSADLRSALQTLDAHGRLAVEAFRLQGMDGFAMVRLYGPVLAALGNGSSSLPLDQALIVLRVNAGYVEDLLHTQSPEVVARYLRHVAAVGLVDAVGGGPNALRLAVEFGSKGEQALRKAGPDAADVVFDDYSDATLRNQAVDALAEHGTMALAMLEKYSSDPDFRQILGSYGPAVIGPVARADVGPETLAILKAKPQTNWSEWMAKQVLSLSGDSGQATIGIIKKDGIERVAELDSSDVSFQQFLPLYDLLHLGSVLSRGHTPTSGEMTWAVIDGAFVVADILSLSALQPEGVAASEAARAEVKAAVKAGVKSAAKEAVEEAGSNAARTIGRRATTELAEDSVEATARVARWWAVRAVGGTYQVLKKVPQALQKMTVTEIADLGRALCTRSGLRLATWRPLTFLKSAGEVVYKIPADRGLKYVGAQMAQAGVGVLAFHKMEEHLASRRPRSSQ